MSNKRIALTYLEYVECIKESFKPLALHPIFDIPEPYVDIAFQSWMEHHSLDAFQTYLVYILSLPSTQEHLDIDQYLFCDAKDLFVSMIQKLFEYEYLEDNAADDDEHYQYLVKTMDEIYDKVEIKDFNMDMLKEEIERNKRFNEKVNDNS